MARQLLGPDGEPIDSDALKRQSLLSAIGGVRQVQPSFPSWGITPERLGLTLRTSVGHDPSSFYELCTDIEEKDLHYQGVLSQRRLAVMGLPVMVDPASDSAEHVKHADLARAILESPEFGIARIGMLDALGRGMHWTRIDWDTSEGQWMPTGFEHAPPAWFRFDRTDLTTPLILNEIGVAEPLARFGWISHRPMIRTGLPVRDGLTRTAAWAWMFKNFDVKAWMVFLEKYGQPIRIGSYPASAKEEEKRTLLQAITSMGTDAGAIIPEGMKIEVVKQGAGGGEGGSFKDNAVFWNEEMSKLVVGQTGTTDASKGGYAVGRVHYAVRGDIVQFDGIMLAFTLMRDLIRPAIAFNFGPQKLYPRVKIGLGDEQDAQLILDNIGEMVDRGLKVEASQVYPLLGLTEPKEGEDVVLLSPISRAKPGDEPGGTPTPKARDRARPPRGVGDPNPAEESAAAEEPAPATPDAIEKLAQELADEALLDDLRKRIEDAVVQSTSLEEVKARLEGLASGPAGQKLVELLALAMFNAQLAGDLGAPIRDLD